MVSTIEYKKEMSYIEELFDFKDKVVSVTGAAGFLCSEMTWAFHRTRCKVAILDSDINGAETLAQKIRDDGGRAMALEMDTSRKTDFEVCLELI